MLGKTVLGRLGRAGRSGERSFVPGLRTRPHRCRYAGAPFGGIRGCVYYVAGLSGMVMGMRDLLRSLGISEDNVKTEEFGDYGAYAVAEAGGR